MPKLKYTARKSGDRDSESTGPSGAGDLGASVGESGCGSGDGNREEEGEVVGSEFFGESSEAFGMMMSGAMGSESIGNPDTSDPILETSTGASRTVQVSDVELADICSGLKKTQISRSGAICPEAGCGKLFTKVANASRHCIRFHRRHLD